MNSSANCSANGVTEVEPATVISRGGARVAVLASRQQQRAGQHAQRPGRQPPTGTARAPGIRAPSLMSVVCFHDSESVWAA